MLAPVLTTIKGDKNVQALLKVQQLEPLLTV